MLGMPLGRVAALVAGVISCRKRRRFRMVDDELSQDEIAEQISALPKLPWCLGVDCPTCGAIGSGREDASEGARLYDLRCRAWRDSIAAQRRNGSAPDLATDLELAEGAATHERLARARLPRLPHEFEDFAVPPVHPVEVELQARGVLAAVRARCDAGAVMIGEVWGPSRLSHVVEVRRAVCLFFRSKGWSWPQIGRLMKRDHSSVMELCNARNRKKAKIRSNPASVDVVGDGETAKEGERDALPRM
jgi:hypothetical protein